MIDRTAWGVIAATGIALIAVSLGPHRIGDYYTETDFYGGYVEGARLIQHGRIDPARYGVIGPVYELVLALTGFVTRDLFAAAQVISIGAATGTLLLAYRLVRHRAGALAALVTIALLAANPTFVRYGYSATTDMLALLLVTAASFAMVARRGAWAPLAAGVLSALAALTRYSAIALLPGAVVCYAWLARAEGMTRRRALALYLAGFAVVAVPWLVAALRAGAPPGAMLFHDIAYDIYASARGSTWAEYQKQLQPGFGSFLDVLLRDPVAVVRRESSNFVSHLTGDATRLLGWPVAATCLAGLVLAFRDGWIRKLAPLWFLGAMLYLTLVPAFYSERYSMVLAPFYLTLAGIVAASPWLTRRLHISTLPIGIVLVGAVFAVSAVTNVSAQREALAGIPREVIPAARALKSHARRGARVMALKSHIAYYSGLGFAPMPSTSLLPELADSCRAQGVEYLYYSWLEANNRPSFWYLLDPQADVPGLTREAFVPGQPAALYRISPGFGPPPAWLADDSARSRSEARVIAAMPPEWKWRAHLSLAVAARERERYRDVLAHASVVCRDQPSVALGWRLSGDAAMRLGDPAAALAAFERALALEPGSVDTRIRLGWLLVGSGQAARAAQVWRPAVRATTNQATLEQMIELYHSQGDAPAEQEARAALRRL